jgi:hypothetical protein
VSLILTNRKTFITIGAITITYMPPGTDDDDTSVRISGSMTHATKAWEYRIRNGNKPYAMP